MYSEIKHYNVVEEVESSIKTFRNIILSIRGHS